MNVQDAKDLHITEGDVRTIHDSSGKQLWGRVNYDTKYAGDTYQQTYSGANLYNYTDMSAAIGSGITTDGDGWITCTYDNSAGTSTHYSNYYTKPLALTPSTNYALVLEIRSVSGTGRIGGGGGSSNSQVETYGVDFADMTAGSVIVVPIISKSDVTSANGLRTYFRFNAGQSGSVTVRFSVLADTSVTPETFVYQPYTGGIPAPNPDYPQPINVVTGTQTVTITGGTVSNNFTLNLGTLELCKIGSYQDYIYKSGDDWYVHKETNKLVFDGSQDEDWAVASSGTANFYYRVIIPQYLYGSPAYSNYFTRTTIGASTTEAGFGLVNSTAARFRPNFTEVSLTDWKTWVSSHNISLYYIVSSTDTKITDTELVSQLESIHEWVTRYGYNATVTGNLPLIINQTTLS